MDLLDVLAGCFSNTACLKAPPVLPTLNWYVQTNSTMAVLVTHHFAARIKILICAVCVSK